MSTPLLSVFSLKLQ